MAFYEMSNKMTLTEKDFRKIMRKSIKLSRNVQKYTHCKDKFNKAWFHK